MDVDMEPAFIAADAAVNHGVFPKPDIFPAVAEPEPVRYVKIGHMGEADVVVKEKGPFVGLVQILVQLVQLKFRHEPLGNKMIPVRVEVILVHI